MIQYKKILMTLALLITAVTGAWAQSSLKVVELEVPADWEYEYSTLTAADLPGFYALTLDEAQKWTGAPAEGYAALIYAFDGENKAYHVPFENGAAGQEEYYQIQKYLVVEKNVKIYYTVEPTEWPLTPDADKKVWTLAKMPANNIELQVAYYPGMLTLPASLTGGKLSVEGLTAPFTKLEVLATWENDNTLLSAAHLPGLKEMTDDEAEKWADAPSGDVTLIYGFDGTKAIMATYKDGKFKSFVSTKDVTLSQLKYESAATEFYYSSEAQMPAGFETDGTDIYVAKDTKFTVKATPAEGYHLVGWSDDATNKELEREFTMTDDDFTVTAQFSNEYTIAFNAANANTIESGKATVKVGDTDKTATLIQDGKLSVKYGQTVTLNAKNGYKFKKVEAKKGGGEPVLLTTITAADNSSFKSGSQTFGDVATVTLTGDYLTNDGSHGGWYCLGSNLTATISVAEANGANITSVKFYTAGGGSAEDKDAPFEVTTTSVTSSNITTYLNGNSIGSYGVSKIEVYGTK